MCSNRTVQTDHECRLECEAVSKSVLEKYQTKARLQNLFAIICYVNFVNVLNIQHTRKLCTRFKISYTCMMIRVMLGLFLAATIRYLHLIESVNQMKWRKDS